ncbi:MAG: DUF4375 domain-containing protein [Gemmataceae bacterium]|nr:DUF4375 domain-containing protein [Gemmataceae bacterium]
MDWYDAAGEYYRLAGYEWEALPADWRRELVALKLISRGVPNGGYLQFYANNGRAVAALARRALTLIGAHRMAEIAGHCQAVIDEHAPDGWDGDDDRFRLMPNEVLGRDGTVLEEAGSPLPESVMGRLRELSYEFMDYPDDVGDQAEAYYRPLIDRDPPAGPAG